MQFPLVSKGIQIYDVQKSWQLAKAVCGITVVKYGAKARKRRHWLITAFGFFNKAKHIQTD